MADTAVFDPSKPFTVEPPANEDTFDPSKPYTVEKEEPTSEFDPSKPFTVEPPAAAAAPETPSLAVRSAFAAFAPGSAGVPLDIVGENTDTAAREFAGAVGKGTANTIGGTARAMAASEHTPLSRIDADLADLQAQRVEQQVLADKGDQDAAEKLLHIDANIEWRQKDREAALPTAATDQAAIEARKKGEVDTAELMTAAAKNAETFYGQKPGDMSPAAQIGRGAGNVFTMVPGMMTGGVGLAGTVLQAGSASYAEAYNQTATHLREQGITDPTEIDQQANQAGSAAAVKTIPEFGAYMVGGKLSSMAVAKLFDGATPLVKALFGAAGATGSNMATSATIRAIHGEPLTPTIEGSFQDLLFGLTHGMTTGMQAHRELNVGNAVRDKVNQDRAAAAAEQARIALEQSENLKSTGSPLTAEAVITRTDEQIAAEKSRSDAELEAALTQAEAKVSLKVGEEGVKSHDEIADRLEEVANFLPEDNPDRQRTLDMAAQIRAMKPPATEQPTNEAPKSEQVPPTGEEQAPAPQSDRIPASEEREPVPPREEAIEETPGEVQSVEPPTSTAVAGHPTIEVPLEQITLSRDVPQFKAGANEEGVVEPIAGKYERTGTPPVQIWERLNGNKELISGRHRFDLAKRTGEQSIPSQIHREADGFTAKDAATLDAELNIRDEQGSSGDYAYYFRDSGITEAQANERGLLARAKGKTGWSIARNGSPDLFALHQSGRITDAQARAIADAAPGNESAQQVGIRAALEGKSGEYIGNLIKAATHRAGPGETTADLFSFDDSAMREMEAQAKRASAIQSDLRKTKAAITGAAKDPARAKTEGIDVHDPEAVKARVAEINAELERWENWPMHSDLLARTRGEAPAVPAPELPKLRTGEKQGDIFANQTEDLKLTGETTTDGAAKQAEAERITEETRAAKEKQDREQTSLFDEPAAEAQATAEPVIDYQTQKPLDSVTAARVAEIRARIAPIVEALGKFFPGGIHFTNDRNDSGGFYFDKGALVVSLRDYERQIKTDEAANRSILQEGIHSILVDAEKKGTFSAAGLYNALPATLRRFVRESYRTTDVPRDLGHEFLRMVMEREIALGSDGKITWTNKGGEKVTEQTSPTLYAKIKKALDKLLAYLGNLSENLRTEGASPETIKTIEQLKEHVKSVLTSDSVSAEQRASERATEQPADAGASPRPGLARGSAALEGSEKPRASKGQPRGESVPSASKSSGPGSVATDTLNKASSVVITAPKGATFLRVTEADGKKRQTVESIKNVGSGLNVFHEAGPYSKIEAGTLGKDRKFVPMEGEVLVADKNAKPEYTDENGNAISIEKLDDSLSSQADNPWYDENRAAGASKYPKPSSREILSYDLEPGDRILVNGKPATVRGVRENGGDRMTFSHWIDFDDGQSMRVFGRSTFPLAPEVDRPLLSQRDTDPRDSEARVDFEETKPVPTQVMGQKYTVNGKPSFEREKYAKVAKELFDEAGIPVIADPVQDARGETVELYKLADGFTQNEEAGQRLLKILRREVQDGNPNLSAFLDSIVDVRPGEDRIMNAEAFSNSLRKQLFSQAQGQRSFLGRQLRALVGISNDILNVSRHVDVELANVYHKVFSGEAVDSIVTKLLTQFRNYFTDSELTNFANRNNDIQHKLDRLIALNERDKGSKVYRRVQTLLSPKKAPTIATMENNAHVQEAVRDILKQAAALGITPKETPGKKLTALEKLLLLVSPENSEKIEGLTREAVAQAEHNAGVEATLDSLQGKAKAEAEALFEAGDLVPERDMIEAGLTRPKYAHWRDIRENLLGYSPVTLDLARDVIKGEFKGTRFGTEKEPKPQPVKIDLNRLAVQPDVEVKRVMDETFAKIEKHTEIAGATAETKQRIADMIRGDVGEQLKAAKQRFLDNYFEPKEAAKTVTPSERIQKLLNAGAAKDPRFKGEKVRVLVKKIASQYLRGENFRELATRARAEKNQWIKEKTLEIAKKEKFTDSDEADYLTSVVFGELAHRLGDAEEKITHEFLSGKAASYEQTTATPDETAQRLADAKAKLAGKINARAFDVATVNEIAKKSSVQKLVPNLKSLTEEILQTPFYRQGELADRFAQKLTNELGVDPALADKVARSFGLAFELKSKEAQARAQEKVLKQLTPAERKEVPPGSPLWKKIIRAANAGVMDTPMILENLAREKGFDIPTDAQVAKMKSLAEEEQRLRDLTPEQLKKIGDDPAKLEEARRFQEAATTNQRSKIKKELQQMWTRFSEPIKGKTQKAGENRMRAVREYASANLLTTLTFPPKQVLDVLTQVGMHLPTRAKAAALQAKRIDADQGQKSNYYGDLAHFVGEGFKAQRDAMHLAVSTLKETLKGRTEARNVDGLFGSISVFDRIERKADELAAKGGVVNKGKAAVLRVLNIVRLSYRFAQALDMVSGNQVERQEIYEQAVNGLKENLSMPTDQARSLAKTIVGDVPTEWASAIGQVQNMYAERGIQATPDQVKVAAWEVVKSNQYDRMKSAGLPAGEYMAQNHTLKNTVGWNEPEEGGVGGLMVGLPLRAVRRVGELATGSVSSALPGKIGDTVGAGLGLAISSPAFFSNAIATSINRVLSFSGLGYFPTMFKGLPGVTADSPWFRTEKDILQRKAEASMGVRAGAVVLGLAAAGLIRVWNQPPKDPEERKKWTRDGHKAGTVEFNLGDGKFIPISLSTGPLNYIRPYFAAVGGIQDAYTANEKARANAEGRAAKKGAKLDFKDLTESDYLNIAMTTAVSAMFQGRTSAGAMNSYSDQGQFNVNTLATGAATSFIPFLPGYQGVTRMAGVGVDPKKADFLQMLFPTGDSSAQKKNFLGDAVTTPDAMQRVVQSMTGGSYPWIVQEGHVNEGIKPYAVLEKGDYTPPSFDEKAYFNVGDRLRRLNEGELSSYYDAYAKTLRQDLMGVPLTLSPENLHKRAEAAHLRARKAALRSVGVEIR